MGEVVSCGADAGVDEVAEHEEVGSEEEEREEEPAVVEMLVGEDGEGEDDGFFGAEKDGGAGQHELVIRDWGGEGSSTTQRTAMRDKGNGVLRARRDLPSRLTRLRRHFDSDAGGGNCIVVGVRGTEER